MLVLVLFVAFLLTNFGHAYFTCNCYCPSRDAYVGTALSFTCSSAACSIACLGSFVNPGSCSSPKSTHGLVLINTKNIIQVVLYTYVYFISLLLGPAEKGENEAMILGI
jgi:hypothetical protein